MATVLGSGLKRKRLDPYWQLGWLYVAKPIDQTKYGLDFVKIGFTEDSYISSATSVKHGSEKIPMVRTFAVKIHFCSSMERIAQKHAGRRASGDICRTTSSKAQAAITRMRNRLYKQMQLSPPVGMKKRVGGRFVDVEGGRPAAPKLAKAILRKR